MSDPTAQPTPATPSEAEQIKALRRERDAWKMLAEARNKFLVAYRTGGRPPESAFAAIEKAKKVLGLE